MAEQIRLVQEEDLIHLQYLYKNVKTVAELRWLLQDPEDNTKLNGYVAVNVKGDIVGMIGYVSGQYYYGNKKVIMTIPMSWKIADNYKGLAGVMLFKKVIQLSEIGLTIEGSDLAQSIYPMFGLKNICNSHTYMKLLNPLKYAISLKGKTLLHMVGNFTIMLQSYFSKNVKFSNSLDIVRVNIEDVKNDIPYSHTDYFEKEISANYIKWLLKCPVNDTFAFEIRRSGHFLGYVVCYVKNISKSIKRGRVVYMPNFGSDQKYAKDLIAFLETFLRKEGCASISISALDKGLVSTLKISGFIDYRSKCKPVYLRPINAINMLGIDTDKWFMQYTEGDKAYRAI